MLTDPGAGERARELAHSIFKMHTCGGFDRGMPQWDIELATKLIEGALAAVRLEEARCWIGNMHSHEKPWPGCDHCAYLVALERAVEGK